MSKRYWSAIFAACGLILFATQGLTKPAQTHPPYEGHGSQSEASPNSPAAALHNPITSERQATREKEADERSNGDLNAQRGMEKAANEQVGLIRKQNRLFLIQNWIVGIEAALLFFTLVATALAAKSASRAALASVEAVRTMRNSERPYFTPFDPELRGFADAINNQDWGQVLSIHLILENVGRSVGFLAEYGIAHEICAEGKQGLKALEVRTIPGSMPLSAGGKLQAGAAYDNFQISDADRTLIVPPFARKILYVYGYLRYWDLNKVFRRTGFMFEFLPNRNAPEESTFVICQHSYWYDVEENPKSNPNTG